MAIAKYLDSDGAGEHVEILEQLADAQLVPRVPVLLPEDVLGGELVDDVGAALRGRLGEQLRLRPLLLLPLESSIIRSKMLDRASHSALIIGEWYIPGHRLSGFRADLPTSIAVPPPASLLPPPPMWETISIGESIVDSWPSGSPTEVVEAVLDGDL
jgi:hypothetical protein